MRMKNSRESGIELLKIIAMFLIVLYHSSMSVTFMNGGLQVYPIVSGASTDPNVFMLNIFGYFGHLGCTIFFVCSAWFLVESTRVKSKKVVDMLSDVWTVSVLVFFIFFVRDQRVATKDTVINALLPNTLAVNWYITCYLLFYLIHPLLNLIIRNISKRTHLLIVALSIFLYYLVSVIFNSPLFYVTNLVMFMIIYFLIAYMKKYMRGFSENLKANVVLLVVGLIGFLGEFSIMNFLGLQSEAISAELLRFNNNENFFIVMIAVSLFNLFRRMKKIIPVINYISSLTLFIYIIHENTYLAGNIRNKAAAKLINTVPYTNLIPAILLFAAGVFVFAMVVSMVYKLIVKRPANFLAEKIYLGIKNCYLAIEKKIMSIE